MATQEIKNVASSRPPRQVKTWILLAALLVTLGALIYWQQNTWQLVLGMQQNNRSRPAADLARPMFQVAQPVSEEFEPVVVIPRSFPPIEDVPIAKADEVTGPRAKMQIQDNELVLGVEINGEARAYPINMMTGPQREIINDTLGGTAIAATW